MSSDARKSNIRKQIDENFKRVYEDALKEDVPDKFVQLVEQLRAKRDAADDK